MIINFGSSTLRCDTKFQILKRHPLIQSANQFPRILHLFRTHCRSHGILRSFCTCRSADCHGCAERSSVERRRSAWRPCSNSMLSSGHGWVVMMDASWRVKAMYRALSCLGKPSTGNHFWTLSASGGAIHFFISAP